MSMLQATDVHQSQEKSTDRKAGQGFVLLICVALGLAAFLAAMLNPAPIGNGIGNDTFYVGP